MSKYVRTPESRFTNLPDFPYTPNYVTLPSSQGLRLAYIDECSANYHASPNSRVFLCLHGVPTWSYLYRKMIPVFLSSDNFHKEGVRVICPDFLGWGRSDKPTASTGHSFHNMYFHRKQIVELIEALDLRNITLVVQDWGGLIGLTVPFFYSSSSSSSPSSSETFESRFARIILFNTVVPAGGPAGPGFMNWRRFVQRTPDMNVRQMMQRTMYPMLGKTQGRIGKLKQDVVERMRREERLVSDAELDAYNAPFPSQEFKYAIQTWPLNVPISKDYEGMDVWREGLKFWDTNRKRGENGDKRFIKVFQAHGWLDPVFPRKSAKGMFKLMIPGAANIDDEAGMALHCGGILYVPYGGHFLQEQGGDYVARQALKFFGDLPLDPIEYEWCVSTTRSKKNANKLVKRCNILKLVLCNKPVNTFSSSVLSTLCALIKKFDNNSFVRGFILASNFDNFGRGGSRIFSAGLDLFEIAKTGDKSDAAVRQYMRQILRTKLALMKVKKPMVAAINGLALAFGCVVACLCDYRVMLNVGPSGKLDTLNKSKCMIGMPEAADGISIGSSAFHILKHKCGGAGAAYVAQSGLMFGCEEAAKFGLIDESCTGASEVPGDVATVRKNDEILIQKCVQVLGNKYFGANVNAAAQVKYLAMKPLIEMLENEETFEKCAKETADMFMAPGAKEHTLRLKNKNKNRQSKL